MSTPSKNVYIETVTIGKDRQVSRDQPSLKLLADRTGDISSAIEVASDSIRSAASKLTKDESGLGMTELTVKFGITLGAEGGVIVSKATLSAALEVELKFSREA